MLSCQFYLSLHKAACGHFKGKVTNTLMGQEKVGGFPETRKTSSRQRLCRTRLSDDAKRDQRVQRLEWRAHVNFWRFFSNRRSHSQVEISSKRHHLLLINSPKSKSRDIVFNYFLTHFFSDIRHAATDELKVRAIAKFIQRLEWLHSVRDGCGRTDPTALLNYLLTILWI